MTTKAVRLYGKNDLRLESFELPPIKNDEILAKVVCDSLCMSSYKVYIQGKEHKRVPKDIDTNPIIIGHEFCGVIEEVGSDWADKFSPGQKFAIQPALNYKGSFDAPGYSFPYIGGNATYIIIPNQVMELGCLLPYESDTFFYGALAEPVSCVIGSLKEFFHRKPNSHELHMGIKPGGTLAILAGAGPMGLAAVDYAIHAQVKPSFILVTDIDENRLAYAERVLSPSTAKELGITLVYVNTSKFEDIPGKLKSLSPTGDYDDVLVMVPVRELVESGSKLLAYDGCFSFFAGPSNKDFEATINFYDIHYGYTHYIGTVGGNSDDMIEAIEMSTKGLIDPAILVTHVGGLNSAADATADLPNIPGGKKLIYTHLDLPLTALSEFKEKGKTDKRFYDLARIIESENGLWCPQAEKYLLDNF